MLDRTKRLAQAVLQNRIQKPPLARREFWPQEGKCPICNNDSLMKGEFVDVGVGMQQVSPDVCFFCNYIQPSSYAESISCETYSKCWELQVQAF